MRRFLTAVLLLTFASPSWAGPAPSLILQESGVIAAARAYAAELCKAAPKSCGEAKRLLDDYQNALRAATACEKGGCALEQIREQAKAVAALDLRQAALMPPAGRPDRPYLALSAVALARLTAAATRLGKPYHARLYGPDRRTEARRDLEGFCLAAAEKCREMRDVVARSDALRPQLDACEADKTCALERVDGLIEEARGAIGGYFALNGASKLPTTDLYFDIAGVHDRGIALFAPLSDQAVAALNKDAGELEVQLGQAEKDRTRPIAHVEASGRAVFESQRVAAHAADRLAYHLGYDAKHGAGARRDVVNAAAIKLAGLRARALALRTARGLGDDKEDAGGIAAGAGGGTAASGARGAGAVLTGPAKTIIDRRMVPSLSPVSGNAPPILDTAPGLLQLVMNLFSKNPVEQADAMRRLGRTRTVGDPGRYVAAAFTQKDAVSCAVASQAQALQAHGLLPAGQTAASQEQALIEEARKRGHLRDGTPPEYMGSLLAERGMLVAKGRGSDTAGLEGAVKRGGLLQVNVDATVLWNYYDTTLRSHAILVTGAELSKKDDSILGVYVNDSGTRPPGAGRFISWSKFKKAWRGNYAEVR